MSRRLFAIPAETLAVYHRFERARPHGGGPGRGLGGGCGRCKVGGGVADLPVTDATDAIMIRHMLALGAGRHEEERLI